MRIVSVADATALFATQGEDREALFRTAHALRLQTKGERASFVVCRNINFTNVCYMGCQFCGFAKRKEEVELRNMADRSLRRERGGHTLQATALVNEAYLRLTQSNTVEWENRGHFFAAAAETRRRSSYVNAPSGASSAVRPRKVAARSMRCRPDLAGRASCSPMNGPE